MSDAIDFESDSKPQEADGDSLTRLSNLAATLLEEQFRAADLDAQLVASEGRIRQLAEVDIPELLKECGLSEVKLADGTKVTVSAELDCAITDERRAQALAWLREHDLGGIIKTEVALAFGKGEDLAARMLGGIFMRGLPDAAIAAIMADAERAIDSALPDRAERLEALRSVLSSLPSPTLEEGVHWQTLKATLKAEREAGRDVPVETFALRPYEKAKLKLPEGAPKPPAVRKRK